MYANNDDKPQRGRPKKYRDKLSTDDKAILKTLLLHQKLKGRDIPRQLKKLKGYENIDLRNKADFWSRKTVGHYDQLSKDEFITLNPDGTYSLTQDKGLFTAITLNNPALTTQQIEQLITVYNLVEKINEYAQTISDFPKDKVLEIIIKITKQIMDNSADFYTKSNEDFNKDIFLKYHYEKITVDKLIELIKQPRKDYYDSMYEDMECDRRMGK